MSETSSGLAPVSFDEETGGFMGWPVGGLVVPGAVGDGFAAFATEDLGVVVLYAAVGAFALLGFLECEVGEGIEAMAGDLVFEEENEAEVRLGLCHPAIMALQVRRDPRGRGDDAMPAVPAVVGKAQQHRRDADVVPGHVVVGVGTRVHPRRQDHLPRRRRHHGHARPPEFHEIAELLPDYHVLCVVGIQSSAPGFEDPAIIQLHHVKQTLDGRRVNARRRHLRRRGSAV
mmetsp:Transcript_7789/g.25567  ORF Transcript_7789/g.25567 Transcript_7789/m.25567 type:complete len:230 (-) Transcript_7789:124-813(-)